MLAEYLFALYVIFTLSLQYTAKNIVMGLFVIFAMLLAFKQRKLHITAYMIWSFGIAISFSLACIWSPNPQDSFSVAKGTIEIAVVNSLFLAYVYKSDRILQYFLYFVLGGVGLILTMATNFDIKQLGQSRINSADLNANSIGIILMLSSISALTLCIMKKNKYYISFIPIFVFFLIYTGSRKAIFGVLFSFALIWWLSTRSISAKILNLPLAILIIIGAINLLMQSEALYTVVGSRFEGLLAFFKNSGTADESTMERFRLIQAGMRLFIQKPIFGYGSHAFMYVSGFNTYSHNNYIELLVNHGIIITVWYYYIFFRIIKSYIKRGKNIYTHVLFTVMIMFIFFDFANVSWQSEPTHLFIMLAYGVLVIRQKAISGFCF